MDNSEKTKEAIKNRQFRENQRGNQEWTIQRKPKGQSRIDNSETRAILCTKHRTKTNKSKNTTQKTKTMSNSEPTKIIDNHY
jgi:hypothetical protein